MNDELKFELPNRKDKAANKQPKLLLFLILLTLFAVSANIAIVLTQKEKPSNGVSESVLSADVQKKLALKLEKQGLTIVSVNAWKEYIHAASLDGKEAAMIWYRIGKLYQDNADYAKALDSYYRSESYETVDFISVEISRRIQECLESMGKFSALRHELSERVGIKNDSVEDKKNVEEKNIVAEIGPGKITTADLDQQIEKKINQQLTLFASYLSEEDKNKEKEKMLKQFSTTSQRMMFLNQYIIEELLYRKARETGLSKNPDVRQIIRDQERGLLARKMIEKEYADQIKISQGDLNTYYEANKSNYEKPFDEVKNDVFKALRTQKEGEVQQRLFLQLKEQYDVVIHQSAFRKEQPGKTDKDDGVNKGNK